MSKNSFRSSRFSNWNKDYIARKLENVHAKTQMPHYSGIQNTTFKVDKLITLKQV